MGGPDIIPIEILILNFVLTEFLTKSTGHI